jgi:hypothetical protein
MALAGQLFAESFLPHRKKAKKKWLFLKKI